MPKVPWADGEKNNLHPNTCLSPWEEEQGLVCCCNTETRVLEHTTLKCPHDFLVHLAQTSSVVSADTQGQKLLSEGFATCGFLVPLEPQPNAGMGGHVCHAKCLWHHPVRCSQLWRVWCLPLLSWWENRGIEAVKDLTLSTRRARRPPPASRPSFPCGCSFWWLSLTHPSLLRHWTCEPFSYHRGLQLVALGMFFLSTQGTLFLLFCLFFN